MQRRPFAWNVKVYFWEKKNKKHIINLLSADFVKRVVKVSAECSLSISGIPTFTHVLRKPMVNSEAPDQTVSARKLVCCLSVASEKV